MQEVLFSEHYLFSQNICLCGADPEQWSGNLCKLSHISDTAMCVAYQKEKDGNKERFVFQSPEDFSLSFLVF